MQTNHSPGQHGIPATDDRNVIDYYKGWQTEMIRADLDTKRLPFIVALENISGDFNKSSAIRNMNAFLGLEVWIIGKRKYDRRGTVGTHHYEHIKYFDTWGQALSTGYTNSYEIVAFDNVDGAKSLHEYLWPENVIMMFGEEQRGLSNEALALADEILYIPMRGSVRSLNVATASGIAMYDYVFRNEASYV